MVNLAGLPALEPTKADKGFLIGGHQPSLGGANVLCGRFLEKANAKLKELGWEWAHNTPGTANVSGRSRGTACFHRKVPMSEY